MEPASQSAPSRPSFLRAFLPFWITTSLGTVILAVDYYERNAPLTKLVMDVTIDGAEPEEGILVSVNGTPQPPGLHVSLGRKTIVVAAPNAEPAQLEHFVWYGPNQLGRVDLKRSRGSLKLAVRPRPEAVELHSGFGNFTNSSGEFTDLPAGRYRAVFRYVTWPTTPRCGWRATRRTGRCSPRRSARSSSVRNLPTPSSNSFPPGAARP